MKAGDTSPLSPPTPPLPFLPTVASSTRFRRFSNAPVARWIEYVISDHMIVGSSPAGDNFHWQRLEADTGRRAYPLQTPAHHSQGVFGGKQEHGGPVPDASPNAPRIDPGASECHPGKAGPQFLNLKSGQRLANRFYCSLFLRD